RAASCPPRLFSRRCGKSRIRSGPSSRHGMHSSATIWFAFCASPEETLRRRQGLHAAIAASSTSCSSATASIRRLSRRPRRRRPAKALAGGCGRAFAGDCLYFLLALAFFLALAGGILRLLLAVDRRLLPGVLVGRDGARPDGEEARGENGGGQLEQFVLHCVSFLDVHDRCGCGVRRSAAFTKRWSCQEKTPRRIRGLRKYWAPGARKCRAYATPFPRLARAEADPVA